MWRMAEALFCPASQAGHGYSAQFTGLAPSKSVNLAGTQVTLAAGAKLDASGSGDLYGYEFVPGVGG